MVNYSFIEKSSGVRYVRVSKRTAYKAFKNDYVLVVYGKNENPLSPLNTPCWWSIAPEDSDSIFGISWEEFCEFHFNRINDQYEYYNHTKPWYYLPENIANVVKSL